MLPTTQKAAFETSVDQSVRLPANGQTGHDLSVIYRRLAERFAASFPEQGSGPRTVGREAEFPVVGRRGEAVDARRLWTLLLDSADLEPEYGTGTGGAREFIVGLKGRDYSYALEVGLGTVEINTRPCQQLHEVYAIIQTAVAKLVHAAARFDWRVLGYGIQPLSPPSLGLMSPKQRYQSLYRAMGDAWLWYTVTASDQLHVSITRPEMVHMMNYGSLITPIVIALCANSPVYDSKISPFCSAREGVMGEIRAREHRHGMLARPFTDMVDFVEKMSQSVYLILQDNGQIIPSSQPFYEYLREHGPDYGAFLYHEHYIWNSARLRAAYGTLEVRPACQQPWSETMAVAALILGLMESSTEIEAYIQTTIGADYWERMRTYHQQAIRHGLHAPQPGPQFLADIVRMAEAGLRQRGFGEETLLSPIWLRLERSQNPAERIRLYFRSDGMNGLLAHTAIRV